MKQRQYIAYLVTVIAALTACESNDMPVQHADSYDYITFAAKTQKLLTRTNPYEAYNPETHPSTMAVFGYYDIADYGALTQTRATSTTLPNPIFDNEAVSYNASEKTWTTTSKSRWDNYRSATSFDFFGYMPLTTGAKVIRTADNEYTLTIPFSMPTTESIIFDSRQAPIICALPEHKEGTTAEGDEFTFERIVNLQFDQTLTAYRLLFKLDTKMGAMRQFRIKGVSLSGDIATSCNISRTYHWKKNSWTADDITWTDINRQQFTDADITIPYVESDADNADNDKQTMLVSTTDYTQWGPVFYTIPDILFQPTISVTYDVEFTAKDGSTIITRKDITSSIDLNKENFSNLATGKTAMINPIRILIQPRYLYVLADEDAYTGHLLIE